MGAPLIGLGAAHAAKDLPYPWNLIYLFLMSGILLAGAIILSYGLWKNKRK